MVGAETSAIEQEYAVVTQEVLGVLPAETRDAVSAVIPALVTKISVMIEGRKALELEKSIENIRKANSDAMEKAVQDLRKELTPPSPEDIQTLLDQEYATFAITLPVKGEKCTFTIQELPASLEKALVHRIQETMKDVLALSGQIDWADSQSVAQKIERVMAVVPTMADALADCCAICLDPYKTRGITGAWVLENVSATRIVLILSAQTSANRYRDFFSLVSRTLPGTSRA